MIWFIAGLAVGVAAFITGATVWAYDLWRRS